MKNNGIIIILAVLLLVSVIGNIVQAVPKNKSQATPSPSDGCLHGWSQHGAWCYLFSDEQQDWDFSHSNCSSYSASLVTLDHETERALIKSKEDEFWIDLRKERADQPWKMPDGSNITQFVIKGTGFCGYVSGDTVSSTNCDNIRRWICRKPIHAA